MTFLGTLGIFRDFLRIFFRFFWDISVSDFVGFFWEILGFFEGFWDFFGIFVRVYEDFLSCEPLGLLDCHFDWKAAWRIC